MWKPSSFTLPSVLIVDSGKGDLFIVDNESSESQVDKILKKSKRDLSAEEIQKKEIKIEIREPSPEKEPSPPSSALPLAVAIKQEIKQEVSDESNGYESDFYSPINVPLTDPSAIVNAFKNEPELIIDEKLEAEDKKYSPEPTFDGKWSSDEEGLDDEFVSNNQDPGYEESNYNDKNNQYDDYNDSNQNEDVGFSTSDDEMLVQKKPKIESRPMPKLTPKPKPKRGQNAGTRSHFWSHKRNIMVGKIGCKFCETFFSTKMEREAHVCKYLKCNPKNFICRVCGKELSKRTFSNHLHETLACEYCNKKFVNPRNMKEHIKKQHSDKEFKHSQAVLFSDRQKEHELQKNLRLECDLCGKYLFSMRTITNHMRIHTGLRKTFICENCGETFYSPGGIKNHKCENTRKRPEPDSLTNDARHCRFCDKYFEDMDQNKNHDCSASIPDEPKYVKCRCCAKKISRRNFTVHMELHTGIDWICNICNKQLKTERSLIAHKTIHTGKKPKKCSQCPESFISQKALKRHMRFHGADVPIFRCEYCFKQLATSTSLKEHVRRLHSSSKMNKCELCPREFESRADVKYHMQNDHGPFICKFCNKSFSRPRFLKNHEKEHFQTTNIPENRQSCPVCAKYLLTEKIKSHVFRNHRDHFDGWIGKNATLL